MTKHTVKSWPKFFRPIVSGTRTHELRLNDRNYAVGDWLELREWDPSTETYTGARATAQITSLTSDDEPCAVSDHGLTSGYCILSIKIEKWSETAS